MAKFETRILPVNAEHAAEMLAYVLNVEVVKLPSPFEHIDLTRFLLVVDGEDFTRMELRVKTLGECARLAVHIFKLG